MTKQEICEKYNVKEESLSKNFTRTANQIYKNYGVVITKTGRGDKVVYSEATSANTLASTKGIEFIKGVHKEIIMEQATFSALIDWDFMIFLGVVTCPMFVFRGTAQDLLDYVGIKRKSQDNINRVYESIKSLASRGYVKFIEDNSTAEGYFVLSIIRETEVGMKIGIDMIQRCMKLQRENSMNSWVPLLKTWVGLQIITFDKERQNVALGEKVIFTMKELEDITGINTKMLTKCKQILEGDNLFQTSKAFIVGTEKQKYRCIGQKVNLNSLEHDYTGVQGQ